MMKKRFLLNFISLALTTSLLVLLVFGWYISNKEVSASGIVARTKDSDFVLRLEIGSYDENDEDKWTWTPTTSLSITNMQPDNVFFFRFRIEATTTGRINVKMSGVSSTIDNTITLASDNKSVLIGGAKYFELDNTNKVVITGTNNLTLGTLYQYNNSKFSLVDFLVEDTFKFYDYGLGTEDFYKTEGVYYTDSISEAPNEGTSLDQISSYYQISQTGVSYGYFALEFNDLLSLRTYLHLDNELKEDSNLFQAQVLAIKNISVEAV